MTEQEYINVKDLGHVISAKGCLRHVMPETSDIILKKEYQTIWKYLTKWEKKLFEEIKTNDKNYGVPENPISTKTGRTYWHDKKLNKVFMKDVDGKIYDITKK